MSCAVGGSSMLTLDWSLTVVHSNLNVSTPEALPSDVIAAPDATTRAP